ncbi:hypothetical protein WJX72_001582 [[Myrmecia] bisecta]|uniref:DNA repair protein RecN n=1 Tax=[Myrmecia] bisecta TaxID=41462 RepID=A0AAW1QE85_9CHLO
MARARQLAASNPSRTKHSQHGESLESTRKERSHRIFGLYNVLCQAPLSELHIRDFALVADQRVVLRPGLNVITGESGAGKSVLVTALGQLLGGAASDDCIRPPAQTAVVEGRLNLTPTAQAAVAELLQAVGLPKRRVPDPASGASRQLELRREISVTKQNTLRSRCFVNGAATSVRVLRELGALLVDVNGQHAAFSVRDSETQLALLDRIAGISGLTARFAQKLQQLRQAEAQLAAIEALGDEDERDAMQAMVDEVLAARIEPGEERELRGQLRRMESRRSAVERCSMVGLALSGSGGDGGVSEGLRTVESHLKAVKSQEEAYIDADDAGEGDGDVEDGDEPIDSASAEAAAAAELMSEALEALEQARDLLDFVEEKVSQYAEQFRFLQLEHDQVAERLEDLERLFKQYDCSTSDELLAAAEQAERDLDQWFQMEGRRDKVEATIVRLRGEVVEDAVVLSQKRRAAAGKLCSAVESCLRDLAMAGSRFDVRIDWQAAGNASAGTSLAVPPEYAEQTGQPPSRRFRVKASGLDMVEFLLAAGPSEALRPLAAVASGGESARIMLALKAAPAAAAAAGQHGDEGPPREEGGGSGLGSPIMVLDELDSGVGSRLGQAVGQMLRRMTAPGAAASQILCVSHLPQVAAHARHHLRVRKAVAADGRMITQIDALYSQQQRAEEVAAMLGLGLSEAQQMLQSAEQEEEKYKMAQ